MWIDRQALVRWVLGKALDRLIVAILLSLASLPILGTGLACCTYEASYVDSSGAFCRSFSLGNHEVDLCYGRMDR